MKILNFGSLNIDHVYQLDDFVRPGETIACSSYTRFCGGKGLNQSIALAHGGAEVFHGGGIGRDGVFLSALLKKHGVDTRFVHIRETPTGHAIIQVNSAGENAIVISGGTNQCIGKQEIADTIHTFSPDDYLLIQNEISNVKEIITRAMTQGMKIVFNPAPFTEEVHSFPLEHVDIFILNETEARGITGAADQHIVIRKMQERFPHAAVLYTLGSKGALFVKGEDQYFTPAIKVHAIDTTGAGDTFIGFFLSSYTQDTDIQEALAQATIAAAISVTRKGAADSIPTLAEVQAFQHHRHRP